MKQQKIKRDELLARNIRRIRLREDCGVEELARKMQLEGCDITRQTIVKIEAGVRHVSIEELFAIKEAFSTTWDDIFDFEGGNDQWNS